jgi:Cu(I)/Ag(I) efflux system membrane fusion protein
LFLYFDSGNILIICGGFALLSDHVVEMTEYFGLEKERGYKHFCPMALDNEGAYGLSGIEEIRNLYFLKAMLTCGEEIETYRKGQPVYEIENPVQQSSSAGHQH